MGELAELRARRRESAEGLILVAILQLHDEGERLTAANFSLRVTESDDEIEMNARKAGWITTRMGFEKERVPGQ